MKKTILIFYCMLLMLYSFSQGQPCSDNDIMNTKGSWEKRPDANVFPDQGFPKNQFPQATNRIDKMQKLLQAAYPEPKGIEAGWYRSITGHPQVKNGPVPYQLSALFLIYFCNKIENKIEPGGETGTWFYIWVNQINDWFAEYIKYYIIQKQPVYLLQKKIGALNGYSLHEGNYNRTGLRYSRAIIVTRTGQSPYIAVTQKQFLKAFVNYNEKRFLKALAFQKNRTVKTDEEATIAQMKKNHEQDMKPARDLLADSLEQKLEQPAILNFDNLLEFKEFSTEEKGGRQLVRLNPGYFDTTLPKYIPQLFIVHWSWEDRKPANYWRVQIEKNFNFDALKEMIDKK